MTSTINDGRAMAGPAGARPRVLVIEHEADTGLGRLHLPLAAEVDLEIARMHRGDPVPTDLRDGGYAGLIVLGGVPGAWQDDVAPWLPATRRLLAAAVAEGTPTLGICLGGQLLAAACGGVVTRGAAGLEVGVGLVSPLPAADDDPLLGRVPRTRGGGFPAAQWHQDAVVELPADGVLLATGAQYPHQAFRVGPAAWGVQYHPEVSEQDWAAWVAGDPQALRAAGADPQLLAGAVTEAQAELEQVARAHAEAFAAVVCSPAQKALAG